MEARAAGFARAIAREDRRRDESPRSGRYEVLVRRGGVDEGDERVDGGADVAPVRREIAVPPEHEVRGRVAEAQLVVLAVGRDRRANRRGRDRDPRDPLEARARRMLESRAGDNYARHTVDLSELKTVNNFR
jgi:hypothetical protein